MTIHAPAGRPGRFAFVGPRRHDAAAAPREFPSPPFANGDKIVYM
jgi:hypothetical protein